MSTTIKNGYLNQYLNDAFTFVKTLVFKFQDTALLMNEELARLYGTEIIDHTQPKTWKYFLNVSGQYHPKDTMMRVVSIDTLEEIDFTKDNLRVHTATAEEYRYGTRKYFELVKRYPTQQFLINGILNPADIDIAVAAKDGTILSYRKDLIESNETTLLIDLESYIKRLIFRWYNGQFVMSAELYHSLFISKVYSQLTQKLLNLRLERCHTYEVHSFHVRMYLASHGELDRYLPYLTLSQSLWLYRNIRFIERNAGLSEQFYELVDKLLTDRGIPVGEYSIRQIDQFTDYIPNLIARLKPVNDKNNSLTDDIHTVEEVYRKEYPIAYDNELWLSYSQQASIDLFKLNSSGVTQTKMLHSSMADYTNAVPEPFEVVAIRQWAYMANNGLFESYVSFKDPKTSILYSLSAKNAFIYFFYIHLKRDGLEINQLPKFLNMQQRKHPKPTVDDLMRVVDTEKHSLQYIAEDLLSGQPAIQPCFSNSAFQTLITKLYNEAYRHWFIISSMEDLYERAMVDNMIRQLYEDEVIEIDTGASNMGEWLLINNLPDYDYDVSEANLLIKAIYEAVTGIKNDDTKLLKNIQKAMISLMSELSSYTIQFTTEVNDNDLILINWPAVRLGNIKQRQEETRLIDSEVLLLESRGHGEVSVLNEQSNEEAIRIQDPNISASSVISIDPVIDQSLNLRSSLSLSDIGSPFTMAITYDGQNVSLDEDNVLPGFTTFDLLSERQKSTLKSIYSQ